MPFVSIYLPKGNKDDALERAMRKITAAGEELLENTLTRMVRVTVFESEQERFYDGGENATELCPFVLFRIGPGRSGEAKDAFMNRIAEILSEELGCQKKNVRSCVMDNEEGHHFCIGGKPKDFGKKVK